MLTLRPVCGIDAADADDHDECEAEVYKCGVITASRVIITFSVSFDLNHLKF